LFEGVTAGNLESAGTQWFSFEAPETADYGINTHNAGTQFAAVLAVRESCGADAIASATGDYPGRNAYLRVPMNSGQTYSIELGGAFGVGTGFELGVGVTLGTCPFAGDCFVANGDPGCDDTCGGPPCPGCCDQICTNDAFCCDVEWDQICADTAIAECNVVPVELQSFDLGGRR